jgi:hypothetical protein
MSKYPAMRMLKNTSIKEKRWICGGAAKPHHHISRIFCLEKYLKTPSGNTCQRIFYDKTHPKETAPSGVFNRIISYGISLNISNGAKATPAMLGPVWAASTGDI